MPGMEVTVYDKYGASLGYLNNYQACDVEFWQRQKGAGQLVVDRSLGLAERLMQAGDEVVPVTVGVNNRLWTGTVDTAISDGPTGAKKVTATLASDFSWLAGLDAWPDPGSPIGVQLFTHDVRNGACETAVKGYIRDNVARMGNVPVAVVPTPSPDLSAFVSMSARMTPIPALIDASLKVANLGLTVTLWRPTDPQPPGLTLSTPTLVVDVTHPQDKSYVVWDDRLGHIDKASTAVKATRTTAAISGGKGNAWLETTFPALPKDAFLAFDYYVDTDLVTKSGPFVRREGFTSVGAGAFTVDSRLASLAKIAADRGSTSVVATIADDAPWRFGRDYNEGDLVGVHVDGKDFRQQVSMVKVTDDRANGLRVVPTIGDPRTGEDPIVTVYNRIKDLIANIQSLTLGA